MSAGNRVLVKGNLRKRWWRDQHGVRKQTTDVIADSVQLIGILPANELRDDTSYQRWRLRQEIFAALRDKKKSKSRRKSWPAQADRDSSGSEASEDNGPR